MIGTKKKLTTAAFMLVISVLMLTTASYAWFTISTNPEITDLTTQVVVNENLEIALAQTAFTQPLAAATGQTGDQYTWGNIIDLSNTDLTGAGKPYTTLNKTLRPMTLNTTADAFQYPTYGTDGRVSTLADLTVGTRSNGFGNMTDAGGKVYAYYLDFWMQTNLAAGGTVTLSTAKVRSTSGEAGGGTVFTSTNQVLADNIAIAFEAIGETPSATINATAAAIDTVNKTSAGGTYSTPFTGNVVTLVANTPQLVRMYIYLEGASVKNASASLEGALATGALNVQFALAGVDQSMDGQT